jgi:hypothetical protein
LTLSPTSAIIFLWESPTYLFILKN